MTCKEIKKINPNIKLRILNWNIASGDMRYNSRSLSGVCEAILSLKPDIFSLQEIDRNAARSSNVDMPNNISQQTSYSYVFQPSFSNPFEYGNCIFYNEDKFYLTQKTWIQLPNKSTHIGYIPQQYEDEPRSALICKFKAKGSLEFMVINTHLAHTQMHRFSRIRKAQIVKILDFITSEDSKIPTIISGDFNAPWNNEDILPLSNYLNINSINIEYTQIYGCKKKRLAVDHFFSNNIKCLKCFAVEKLQLSDHLIICCDFILPNSE